MFKTFNKQKSYDFINDLNKNIRKHKDHRIKFFAPDEDSDGNFHNLSSALNSITFENDEYRKLFGKYLLSTDFQDQLYLNVGKFLGYNEKEQKKKSIRKKISDAVITSAFKDTSTIRSTNLTKDDKYLHIKDNLYYHILPSEKKNIFSTHYIENNKLIINNVAVYLRPKLRLRQSMLGSLPGYKFDNKRSLKDIVSPFYKNKSLYKICCDLNSLVIQNYISGEYVSESFYNSTPLCFSNKNFKSSFKLESDIAYYRERVNARHPIYSRYKFPVKIEKSFIGKGSINAFFDASKFSNKKEIKTLLLEKISKKITSKDLVLDAKWYKDTKNEDRLLRRFNLNRHKNIVDQIKKTGFWLYKFKNTSKNRKKLHEFFSKNNFKIKFWGDDKYRASGRTDYLVSGDFIVNVGKYFAFLNFPLKSENPFKKINSEKVESVADAVELCIQWAMGTCLLHHIKSQDKNYKKVFRILRSYTKPVNINESIQFMKGQLESSKENLIKHADRRRYGAGQSFVKDLIASNSYFRYPYRFEQSRPFLDPLKFDSSHKLHGRIWQSILEEQVLLKDKKSIGVGNESLNQANVEMNNLSFAKKNIIKTILNDFEKIIDTQQPNNLSKINDWLKAEQLNFCQSYYENFENHPNAVDGTTKAFKKIYKKYRDMNNDQIETLFINIYKNFIGEYQGGLSPEKRVKDLLYKYELRSKKIRMRVEKFHKELPKMLGNRKSKKLIIELSPLANDIESVFERKQLQQEDLVDEIVDFAIQDLKKKLNFPGKKNYLLRFLTPSYNNSGKYIKEIYKKLIVQKRELEESIKDSQKRQKIQDKLDSTNHLLRLWLVEEEMNYIEISDDRKGYFKSKGAKKFFFYPNYKNTSIEKIFTLKNIYMNIWSDDIVDLVLNIISLMQLENSFAIDLEKAILKNEAPHKRESIDEQIARLKKHNGVTTKSSKSRQERHEFWGLINNFVKIQKTINFDRVFYGVGDSFFRVISFLEGFFAYSVSEDFIDEIEGLGSHRNKFMIRKEGATYENEIISLWDSKKETILTMDKAAQQDIRTKNDSFAILQNKDAVFKTIHNEIDSLIKVYGKVFDEIIDTFEEEINQKNMGFFPLQASLSYTLETLIGSWEALNHLKAIKNYINLIEKYDLYNINVNFNQANKKRYITKEDANFLIKKSNTSHSISSLEELSKYLQKNKEPKYQNDIKYRQLLKILRANSIKIEKINGVDCIEKKAFVDYLRTGMGYRNLKKLHFPNMSVRNLGFNSLTAQQENESFLTNSSNP